MGSPEEANDLIHLFRHLPDPRSSRNQSYPLEEILFLVLAGILSGLNHMTDIAEFGRDKLTWLRTILPYDDGVPSHDTIGRVLGRLCPDALEILFEAWMAKVERLEGVVAIDGKTVRAAIRRGQDRSFVHMVSAFGTANGLVLGQLKADEKSNESTAIPRLIESLKLEGAIVTIDASGCQEHIIGALTDAKAEFILGLKANQPTLLEDCNVAFHNTDTRQWPCPVARTEEQAHGRGEVRVCQVLPALGNLSAPGKWPRIKSFIRVVSERFVHGNSQEHTRFYVSSILLDPARALDFVRQHWAIENRLHWCLDVQFDEDKCNVYAQNASENLVVIRHIVLNLLRQAKFLPGGIKSRRMQCAVSDTKRTRILLGIQQ